jgi:hypothetical protein
MSEGSVKMDGSKIIGYRTNTELSQKEHRSRQWDEGILEA